ncbi:MAG: deoxyribodipyrimidine photo-lyase [Bacteroidetes bacterium]|nr:deoxyribodipyrimidine photo-lyase [Bacteroidota bacterium]
MMTKLNVFWFRRDFRLEDNVGLYKALKSENPVLPIFIYDTDIIDKLPKNDARLTFIYESLQNLNETLKEKYNSSIAFYHGKPIDIFKRILKKYDVKKVFTNKDYEPYAIQRDHSVKELLNQHSIEFIACKDQVIFEESEVVKDDGEPYLVFTPYMKKWKKVFKDTKLQEYPSENHLDNFLDKTDLPNLHLPDMGFEKSSIKVKDYHLEKEFLENYDNTRDNPSINGTSRLSPYLRFGLVGYRKIVKKALSVKDHTFLNELIWREFYKVILFHFPKSIDQSFKKKYDRIEWRNNEEDFKKWKNGQTGYPIVDAGMRQLNQTGWMHNRIRMVVGSFLCKHLLIDWRWGEAYFAEKLLDYEMSSNVGGWQWVAGSGVDAAPYFRIFNPYSQTDKFDKDKKYIKKWVPEFETEKYPEPMVEHKFARERCLSTYKEALN